MSNNELHIANALRPRNKAKTKQDYETPNEFLDAVKMLLGIEREGFSCDLACSKENKKANFMFVDYACDSLASDWSGVMANYLLGTGWNWLNPPFNNIKPFVEKCVDAKYNGIKIAVLTPIETTEWAQLCFKHAEVRLLIGRITFMPETSCFPKPCMLSLFDSSRAPNISLWDWRK